MQASRLFDGVRVETEEIQLHFGHVGCKCLHQMHHRHLCVRPKSIFSAFFNIQILLLQGSRERRSVETGLPKLWLPPVWTHWEIMERLYACPHATVHCILSDGLCMPLTSDIKPRCVRAMEIPWEGEWCRRWQHITMQIEAGPTHLQEAVHAI